MQPSSVEILTANSSAPEASAAQAPVVLAAAPSVGDGQFRKLDPRFMRVEQIENWIFEAVVAAFALAGLIVQWLMGWFAAWFQVLLVVAAACLLFILHRAVARLVVRGYEATSYAVSGLGVEIRRGIWWRHVIDVPRSRVQHIDVAQGPLARRYGIAKLILHTAGTENASVELDGLAQETALGIRDFLLRGGGSDGV